MIQRTMTVQRKMRSLKVSLLEMPKSMEMQSMMGHKYKGRDPGPLSRLVKEVHIIKLIKQGRLHSHKLTQQVAIHSQRNQENMQAKIPRQKTRTE